MERINSVRASTGVTIWHPCSEAGKEGQVTELVHTMATDIRITCEYPIRHGEEKRFRAGLGYMRMTQLCL